MQRYLNPKSEYMNIDFAIFATFYPACTAAMKYLIAARYKMLGWEHYETKKDSQIWSFVDFLIWAFISSVLYFK